MVSDTDMKQRRNRLHYAIFTAIVIVAGCASRSELSDAWPPFVVQYAGDTLWSLMLFLGLGLLFPTLSTAIVATLVLVFAYGVEFSQLYSAKWIDSFRETFVGAITLGSGFKWSDFACYTIGCGVGVVGEVIETVLLKKERQATDGQLSSESAPCASADEVSGQAR